MKLIIDVSEFNGTIDWAKAAPHIDGVIVRAGYRGWGGGAIARDSKAIENLKNAARYGLPVGVYFVTQAICITEAIEEAEYCHEIANLAGVKLTLPICFDDEPAGGANGQGRRDKIGKTTRTQTAKAFAEQCRSMGYTSALYCANSWFTTQIDGQSLSQDGMRAWIASYPSSKTSAMVSPTVAWHAWQFTPYGQIPGITTDVDLSYFKEDDLMNVTEFEQLLQEYRKSLQDNNASTWSKAARAWAIKTGLMQGGSDGNYMWQDFMTREQLVTVLYRFAQQIGKA